MALALLAPLLDGCAQRSETVLTGHAVHARDVAKLALGQSTPGDVQRLLGEPDERGDDGSLTYKATAVRRTSRALAGVRIAEAAEPVGWRSTTFRFAGGVLSKICRERS